MFTHPATQTSISRELHPDTSESQIYLQCVCVSQPPGLHWPASSDCQDRGGAGRGLIWYWIWTMCTHSINASNFHWTSTAARVSKTAQLPGEHGSVRNDPLIDPVHHSTNFTFQKEKGLTQTVTLPFPRKCSFIARASIFPDPRLLALNHRTSPPNSPSLCS